MPVLKPRLALAALPLALALPPSPAGAQTMQTNSASYNAGYGRAAGQENQPVNPSLRDASGNLIAVNGVVQTGAGASAFSGGAASASSGAGAGGATAVGNSLTVVTQGNYNVVVVDARQTNTGDVTATTSTNGGGHGP
jgi:holdfast attachment protein HfaA